MKRIAQRIVFCLSLLPAAGLLAGCPDDKSTPDGDAAAPPATSAPAPVDAAPPPAKDASPPPAADGSTPTTSAPDAAKDARAR
jgi:hypothetical protein